MQKATNSEIADVLERIAVLLEVQGANPFRVNAYRRAAKVAAGWERPIAELAEDDADQKLEDLPDIGQSIAGAIREFVHTGRLGLLDRLEGQVTPEELFATVPGIGEALARRIHTELDLNTLEGLELAAHDGRLEKVPGLGPRRIAAIRDSVAAILSRSSRRRARRIRPPATDGTAERAAVQPSVRAILEVDAAYRRRAAAGELKTIAPRRFNPQGTAWLPIMHTEKEGWVFTALYSNTARAHELGKTRDWVVIYYERNGHENQCTAVTERQGVLKGKRVVRGREKECLDYYAVADSTV